MRAILHKITIGSIKQDLFMKRKGKIYIINNFYRIWKIKKNIGAKYPKMYFIPEKHPLKGLKGRKATARSHLRIRVQLPIIINYILQTKLSPHRSKEFPSQPGRKNKNSKVIKSRSRVVKNVGETVHARPRLKHAWSVEEDAIAMEDGKAIETWWFGWLYIWKGMAEGYSFINGHLREKRIN